MSTAIRSPTVAFAVCLPFLVTSPAGLRAGTLSVITTADGGSGSLRAAIKNARSGDTIIFVLPAPATITLTGGELLVAKNLRILGPGAGDLTISGRLRSRVFRVSRATVTIAGLTIADGLAAATAALEGAGGGIYNDHAALTISDCLLTGNTATDPYGYGGGGIFSDGYGRSGGASLSVVNCTFSGNTAANGTSGGGISSHAYSGSAVLTVINCLFSGNRSSHEAGAIISGGAGASATILGTTFSGNSVIGNGGGLGGGVVNEIGTMTIRDCTLRGNSAFRGGGISTFAGWLTVQNCTLSANSATEGGGIFNENGALTLLNSTLSGNSSTERGAGILNYVPTTGRSLLIGSTILGNSTPGDHRSGGDLFNVGGPVASLGYNLCSDAGGGVLTESTDLINTDALLGPLGDNGGPTLTHAPQPGSPAIDQGRNLSASETDQRGSARTVDYLGIPNAPDGDGTDIGAVEVQ